MSLILIYISLITYEAEHVFMFFRLSTTWLLIISGNSVCSTAYQTIHQPQIPLRRTENKTVRKHWRLWVCHGHCNHGTPPPLSGSLWLGELSSAQKVGMHSLRESHPFLSVIGSGIKRWTTSVYRDTKTGLLEASGKNPSLLLQAAIGSQDLSDTWWVCMQPPSQAHKEDPSENDIVCVEGRADRWKQPGPGLHCWTARRTNTEALGRWGPIYVNQDISSLLKPIWTWLSLTSTRSSLIQV